MAGDPFEKISDAAQVPARRSIIDPNRKVYLPPGDVLARIRQECRETGQPVPQAPAEVVRSTASCR